MSVLRIPVTCPHDGGDLSLVTEGKPMTLEMRCVTACETCGAEWLIEVRLFPVSREAHRCRPTPAKRDQLARARAS